MAEVAPEDSEGIRPQELSPRWHGAVTVIGVAMGAFHLYTAATFVLAPMVQRSIHLAFALALLYICYPASKATRRARPTALSLAIGIVGVASCLYILAGWEEMTERTTSPFLADLVFGIVAVVVVLEAS